MSAARPKLHESISSPSTKQSYVNRLFARIAPRYDLITVLLSYGLDRRWKRRLIQMASVGPADRAIDLACGTGDLSYGLAEAGASQVIGIDITARMLTIAKAKPLASPHAAGPAPRRTRRGADSPAGGSPSTEEVRRDDLRGRVRFMQGDMMALPCRDGSATLVTAGYGLRNVPDPAGALGEIFRALAPGGRFLSLEFGHPRRPALDRLYLAYLTIAGSALGLVLHGDPDTYRYIPATLALYPGQRAIAGLMARIGFVEVGFTNLLGGMIAIHFGTKPQQKSEGERR